MSSYLRKIIIYNTGSEISTLLKCVCCEGGNHVKEKGSNILRYSRTLLTRINLDGEQSGYAENPDNWVFL
jgi:hypothetical protein